MEVGKIKGVEYVTQLKGWTVTELAEKIGLARPTVALWLKGRKIPKKHLPKLVELFGIDAEYFDKELDEVDKLRIQKKKLSQDYNEMISLESMISPDFDKSKVSQILKDSTTALIEENRMTLLMDFKRMVSEAEDLDDLAFFTLINKIVEAYGKLPEKRFSTITFALETLGVHLGLIEECHKIGWCVTSGTNRFMNCDPEELAKSTKHGDELKQVLKDIDEDYK